MSARWLRSPIARLLATPASWGYGAVVAARNACYDRRTLKIRRAAAPVICVGNITTGGTGKTPMVIAVVRRLRALDRKPAVVTRGYGSRPGEPADEVLEFRTALPDVPVVVDPDRFEGAERAMREQGADCVVLDDGFQHRRLHRDLDIVLIDALDPWGGGRLLPAGLLREPPRGLRRAHIVVLTRSNQVPAAQLAQVEAEVRRRAGDVPLLRSAVCVDKLVGMQGESKRPECIRDAPVFAVCGIGNPRTFSAVLESLACRVVGQRTFPDHHGYDAADVAVLARAATAAGAEKVVTTRKDWVKLAPLWRGAALRAALWRLDIRSEISAGQHLLDACLARCVGKDT